MAGARVLVFGASGVGKSSACARLAESDGDVVHLRASELLSEVTGEHPELLRTASGDAIRRNQLLLAEALDRRAAEIGHATVLLDGHAVIDNDRSLIRVPAEAVAALRPDGMLLLEALPETVLRRRRIDGRPRPDRTISEIAAEISAEREAVLGYERGLRIPLVEVWAEPTASLDHAVASLLRRIRRQGA